MTDALALVRSFEPYLEFQSTLDYLKNPPPGYLLPPVDLLAGLSDIELKLLHGAYSNEWDFQTDISVLLQNAHDGHLQFTGDVRANGITVSRSRALVSLSEDGQQLPKVYDSSR